MLRNVNKVRAAWAIDVLIQPGTTLVNDCVHLVEKGTRAHIAAVYSPSRVKQSIWISVFVLADPRVSCFVLKILGLETEVPPTSNA